MPAISLRLRSLLIAAVALCIFIPATVFTLSQAYTTSLEDAKYNELKLMNLGMISVFEIEENSVFMPDMLYNDQLNLPDSGYQGVIKIGDRIVWKSASSVETTMSVLPHSPTLGSEQFLTDFSLSQNSEERFAYSFTAEFDNGVDYIPVSFFIFNNKIDFTHNRALFLSTVWRYLGALGIVLLFLLIVGMNTLLKPVRKLLQEISQTSSGEQKRLVANYPSEFTPLQKSINQLLNAEEQQRQRYKNSLGDLAHSLKTPLAVSLGTDGLPTNARVAMQQIDALIQRQLKRAAAGASGWTEGIAIAPVANQVVNALCKVYRDKHLKFAVTGDQGLFYGDTTDLMEIIGNLMDNACKAAIQHIKVSIKQLPQQSELIIEDDGAGIPQDQIERLLTRGQRLDTYTEGQGIGMAVVTDLVGAYNGKLDITTSPLGGACCKITFVKAI